MTGVDDPYEQPTTAELTIDTAVVPLDQSVTQAYALLTDLLRTPERIRP
jgi:adenylylsulfate kinase